MITPFIALASWSEAAAAAADVATALTFLAHVVGGAVGLRLDRERRPELHGYVRRHYRRLHEWLVRHEPGFAHYGDTGVWDDRRALRETEARTRIRTHGA